MMTKVTVLDGLHPGVPRGLEGPRRSIKGLSVDWIAWAFFGKREREREPRNSKLFWRVQ